MTDEPDELRALSKQGKGIREVLQAVEDALIDAGYDDFMVKTDRGSFRWQTVETRASGCGQGVKGQPKKD